VPHRTGRQVVDRQAAPEPAAGFVGELTRALPIALLVLAVHLAWLAAWLSDGHSARDLVHVGQLFIGRSTVSQAITRGPVPASSYTGFDGQFYYFMAIDPRGAAPYIDYPSYRYQRIGYALAARAAALGRRELVPQGLLTVNLLAIFAGTLALAAWLAHRGLVVWPAAVWGLHPGQLLSISSDLSDAAGYGVAAIAIWMRDRWLLPSGLVFGLAGVTRETTLIFPGLLLLGDLLALRSERRIWPWARALLAGAAALLPFVGWKLLLWRWLGNTDLPLSSIFTAVPFGAIVSELRRSPAQAPLLAAVVLPALICLCFAGWALWRRIWRIELAILVANVLALVVFASANVYGWWPNATRVGLGVALSAVVALAAARARTWFWLAAGMWLWLTPVWAVQPSLMIPAWLTDLRTLH
jgi:hypothetical protein